MKVSKECKSDAASTLLLDGSEYVTERQGEKNSSSFIPTPLNKKTGTDFLEMVANHSCFEHPASHS